MASLDITACIDAALDGFGLQQATSFNGEHYRLLGCRLRVLKRFALTICSNNLGSEETLGSLLETINYHVRRISTQSRGWDPKHTLRVFQLKTMLYWGSTRGGIRPLDVVLQMMTSILEALLDLGSTVVSPQLTRNLREYIEELEEQLSLFKGHIPLAALAASWNCSVAEPLNVLFSQAVSFYSRAAFFLFTFVDLRVLVSEVSILLVAMKPMYVTVISTLIRALSNTKLPSMDDDDDAPLIAVKRFLDPLKHVSSYDSPPLTIPNRTKTSSGLPRPAFPKSTMASLYITAACIDAALDGFESQQATSFNGEHYRLLGFRLRALKRFALTIRSNNLGSEETLGSLMETINYHVRRISTQSCGWEFKHTLCFFELKTMLYWGSTRGESRSLDVVLQMMTSILEALLDLRSIVVSPQLTGNLRESIEELEEQLSFFKGLITLAASWKSSVVEPRNALFSQAVSFYSRAEFFLFTFEDLSVFVSGVSKLLVEMRPIIRAPLSNTKLPSMDDDDDDDAPLIAVKRFLDPLISFIWYLLKLDNCAVSFKDLQELYRGIRSLRALELQPSNLNVKMKQQIVGAVWDAGSILCSLHSSQLGIRLKYLLESISAILTETGTKQCQKGILRIRIMVDELKASPAQRSNLATSMTDEGVVGFQGEGMVAVDQLTRGSMQLQMLAIVGMPGLGKTTFATMLYNNSYVSLHFHIRAWSPVSQVVDKNKVFRDLFNQIDPAKCSKTPEQDLADGLRKSLKGRRYLIVLDDVWDVEVWGHLKESFPDDDVGSRIILTSRQHDVAPPDLMVDGKPHCLHPLSEADTMELLHRKLSYSGYDLLPPLSHDLRMKIAEKCRGLPLIIVILAGLLKSVELEGWDEILDGLSNVSSTEQCRTTLELSYSHLPAYLRPCLLYFGALREDREVSVRRLVRLWIAEGFIHGDELKSQEDVAQDCFNDLIGRSLIMVGKQRTLGGVKAWKIHDLIHDFCKQKAKEEHFFHFLKGNHELSAYIDSEVHHLPRLCIDSEVEHFRQLRLFAPRAQSLIFNSSQATNFSEENKGWLYIPPAIKISKLLKVLDLEQVHFGLRFPGEIKQLVHLTFLAIQGNVLEIPEWIGNLSNLETFVFVGESICQLPKSLWKLRKLQYLSMGMRSYCSLPGGYPDSSSALCKFDRISGVIIRYGEMESTVRMFPNIRKLRCTLRWERDDCNDLAVPSILSKIESLNVLYQGPVSMLNQVSFPENLKKLTLKRFSLSWRNMSTIGELPNLEVLKLIWTTFEGGTWEMKEGEFSKLRFLKLGSSKLVRWRADCDEDQLCRLQKLVLTECSNLEEMPYCLDNISTLEIIEVSRCRYSIVDLVKQIEERRKELMGDSGLKITTNNILGW